MPLPQAKSTAVWALARCVGEGVEQQSGADVDLGPGEHAAMRHDIETEVVVPSASRPRRQ